MSLQLKLFRSYYKAFSLLSPAKAGKSAFDKFQTTQHKNIRERELPFFERATEFRVPFEEEDLFCYRLGQANHPPILLVHGWNSNIASMHAIAESLVQKNYQVIGLNLPAHGPSKLKKTNMEVCHRAFLSLHDFLALSEPLSIISHSFGSAVVSYALTKKNIPIDQLIYLTCPNSIEQVFIEYSQFIGLTSSAHNNMVHLAENILNEKVSNMNVAKFIDSINFNQLTLIHDEYDKVIPLSDARHIYKSSKKANLITMQNIGHYRMLWNPEVIDQVLAILSTDKQGSFKKEMELAAFN